MTSQETPHSQSPLLPVAGFVLLDGLSVFCGLNWPGMGVVLGDLPTWWSRVMSISAGALGLLLIA